MHDDIYGFSTVVGPLQGHYMLAEVWPRLDYPNRLGLQPPALIQMSDLGNGFSQPESPAVSVLRHRPGLGVEISAQLQAELMVGSPVRNVPPLPGLLWEPGFLFRAAQAGMAAIPDPFYPAELNRLASSAPSIASGKRASGTKVAVLDTGLLGGGLMTDFLDSNLYGVRPGTPASDGHGHGTAVAKLIQTVAPQAVIHPLRVLDKSCLGRSYDVFAGLLYALWSGKFQLINASLTTQSLSACESSLGKSLDYMLSHCAANAGHALPVLVAAAGNIPGRNSGYPARLKDAVVALATDAAGRFASYNSTPPTTATVLRAYGGSSAQPLGDLTSLTGSADTLYGTSFAAAVISGAYMP